MKDQITLRNNKNAGIGSAGSVDSGKKGDAANLVHLDQATPDNISWWLDQYFQFEVTTAPESRKVQRRDILHFIMFMIRTEGDDLRPLWTPRLSRAFQEYLRTLIDEKGKREYGERSIKRITAHLKTFSKWVHKLRPFPLGNPMEKITTSVPGTGLEVERALTDPERRRILDAADRLLIIGGRSRDRKRYRKRAEHERPQRKAFRPYRNRAIIYCLIETGMRRSGVINIILDNIDFGRQTVTVKEKGSIQHTYNISRQALDAIQDYLGQERDQDFEKWQSPYLFLTSSSRLKTSANGKMSAQAINNIWNDVCKTAGVEGKTTHSARHGMGRYIMAQTGNIAAVQRQLGHRNPAYAMEYSQVSRKELLTLLDERGKV